MKRYFIHLINLLFVLYACENRNKSEHKNVSFKDTTKSISIQSKDNHSDSDVTESISYNEESLKEEFNNYKIFKLDDTIKADLNGDQVVEAAYFTGKQKKELIIVDGSTHISVKAGLDSSFGNMGSDFNWVDYWGITNDKETFEVIIKDDEIVGEQKTKLNNKSLFVRKMEAGGGVLTFRKGKYSWIHQSD